MHGLVNFTAATALVLAQFAATAPALAQSSQPQVQPIQPLPGQPAPVRPPRPTPVRPAPGTPGGPQIQPPRPNPVRPAPVRPQPVQPIPVRPNPQIQPPVYPGNGNWNGQTIRCESQNFRYRQCRANTNGGVRLVRVRGGNCVQGRTWGYNPGAIWVNNGCRGDFQTRGNGWNNGGNNGGGGGPSAGAIIGGVAIAGGLIALLSQGNKNKSSPAQTGNVAPALPQEPFQPPAAPSGPARIIAQTGGVTPGARPSLDTCLNEAARQIGATGGTEIRLDRLDDIEPGNGGYRFRFQLVAVYPDETRTIPTFCRATPTTLVELTFG